MTLSSVHVRMTLTWSPSVVRRGWQFLMMHRDLHVGMLHCVWHPRRRGQSVEPRVKMHVRMLRWGRHQSRQVVHAIQIMWMMVHMIWTREHAERVWLMRWSPQKMEGHLGLGSPVIVKPVLRMLLLGPMYAV